MSQKRVNYKPFTDAVNTISFLLILLMLLNIKPLKLDSKQLYLVPNLITRFQASKLDPESLRLTLNNATFKQLTLLIFCEPLVQFQTLTSIFCESLVQFQSLASIYCESLIQFQSLTSICCESLIQFQSLFFHFCKM